LKNILKTSFLPLVLLLTFSCSNEPEIGSKVTFYPEIKINGEVITVINKGDSYTDMGAIALAGSEKLAITTSGAVDSNTIGFYKITYESVNVDGFKAAKFRTVVVVDPSPSSINLEGTFVRNGNKNNVTRISDRKYECDNATGFTVGNANTLKMVFYNLDDKTVYAPFQENVSETGISAESSIGEIVSANNFKWIIYASTFYGTAVRNFVRQ
jgi:Domain of unknown function (DUF5011)